MSNLVCRLPKKILLAVRLHVTYTDRFTRRDLEDRGRRYKTSPTAGGQAARGPKAQTGTVICKGGRGWFVFSSFNCKYR